MKCMRKALVMKSIIVNKIDIDLELEVVVKMFGYGEKSCEQGRKCEYATFVHTKAIICAHAQIKWK